MNEAGMEGIQSPAPPAGSSFTPLLLSMAGIVSTAIAIVAYHLVLVKYCYRRRAMAPRLSLPTTRGEQLGNGVDEKILATIPILSYSTEKGDLFRVDQSECVVCLGELEDGDMVRLLPNCSHAFHITCIDEWFLQHASCPVCRSPIVAPMTVVPPLLVGNEEGDGVEGTPQFHEQGSGTVGHDSAPPSRGLFRHCGSMVLPMEEKPRRLVTELKRSLSMDQSYALLKIQRESERVSSSSSSSSSSSNLSSPSSKDRIIRSQSQKGRSIRQLDRVSSMLLRSFSRLQVGRSSTTNGMLPY